MGIWIIVIGTVLGLGIAGFFFWTGKDDIDAKSHGTFLVAILTLIAFPGASVGIASEVDPGWFTTDVEHIESEHVIDNDDTLCDEFEHEPVLPDNQ